MEQDEEVAKQLHDAYERYSKNANWKTQKKCQVQFKDLPEENQVVMISIARLIKSWINKELKQQLKEIMTKPKITLKRYDDSFGYDIEENYYKIE